MEILFPIENESLRRKLWHILDLELRDTEKAHIMNEKGDYVKPKKKLEESERINSQKIFGDEASKNAKVMNTQNTRTFIPEMKV